MNTTFLSVVTFRPAGDIRERGTINLSLFSAQTDLCVTSSIVLNWRRECKVADPQTTMALCTETVLLNEA